MGPGIPIETFWRSATLLTDASRKVRFCNRACEALLGCKSREVIGHPCWEIVRFQDRRGVPFCSPDCPVQRQAGRGRLRPRHHVVSLVPPRPPLELELLTFAVPAPARRRPFVLHVVLPQSAHRREPAPATNPLLARLTRRELEILEFLAAGSSTRTIASELCISPTTVRNHIQHTLAKLRVHGRLEAILALLPDASRSP